MELKDGNRWDYDAGWYYLDARDISEFLNDHAKEGWEAVTVQDCGDRVFCVFRRQIISERTIELNRRRAEAYGIKEEVKR